MRAMCLLPVDMPLLLVASLGLPRPSCLDVGIPLGYWLTWRVHRGKTWDAWWRYEAGRVLSDWSLFAYLSQGTQPKSSSKASERALCRLRRKTWTWIDDHLRTVNVTKVTTTIIQMLSVAHIKAHLARWYGSTVLDYVCGFALFCSPQIFNFSNKDSI